MPTDTYRRTINQFDAYNEILWNADHREFMRHWGNTTVLGFDTVFLLFDEQHPGQEWFQAVRHLVDDAWIYDGGDGWFITEVRGRLWGKNDRTGRVHRVPFRRRF